jgi:hypothetical protein
VRPPLRKGNDVRQFDGDYFQPAGTFGRIIVAVWDHHPRISTSNMVGIAMEDKLEEADTRRVGVTRQPKLEVMSADWASMSSNQQECLCGEL